jgi:hypothetical protein
MSPRRVLTLLVAGLALIAFALWISAQRHAERATLTGALVLPDLTHNVNTVTRVELRKGDGTHATLQKDATGWSVTERGWPTDEPRLRKLLLDLGALNIVEEKTRLPAKYPQLGVEEVSSPKATGTRIEIVSPARTWTLIVGKSSSAKSGYVRLAGAAQALLAAPLLTVDAEPRGWLVRALLDIPAERVREVEEHPADGPGYRLTRDKKEQTDFAVSPLPKRRELTSPGAADPIAGSLSGLTLDDVAKGPAPADARSARALYRTFDGLELDLTGHKDGTRALITVSARSTAKATTAEAQTLGARVDGWQFEIPEYKYSSIFRPLEELLKKPPEPVKKPAKSAPGKAAAPTTPGKATPPAGAAPKPATPPPQS